MNQYESEKEVRNCTKRYILYFAYTTIKKKQIYKEEDKYFVTTTYDVYSSDSLEEIREQRDILLSLISNLNSYYLYIIDKLESKILKVIKKFSKFEDICDYFKISSDYKRNHIKYQIKPDHHNNIIPVLPFKFKNKLEELDFFFRGPSEVPPDYKWDEGEYDGWLQFRWGDGKNAIPNMH